MFPIISHHLCWTTTLQYPSYKKPIKTWRLMPPHPLKLNSNQTRHTQLRTRSSSSCFFPVLATPWLLSQSFKTATVSRSASPQMGVESCWREILDEESRGIKYNKLPQFSTARFKGFLLVKCSHLDGVKNFTWRREEQKKTSPGHVLTQKRRNKTFKKTFVQRASCDAKVPECTKALIPSTPSGIAKACRRSAGMMWSAEHGHYTTLKEVGHYENP